MLQNIRLLIDYNNKRLLCLSFSNLNKKSALKFLVFIKYFKNLSIFKVNSFVDICLADNIVEINQKNNTRFSIFYLALSVVLRVKFLFEISWDFGMSVFSLSKLFRGSIWPERECFDMFGIFFNRNIDLRRILTDYGFEGFPNQKNFPVSGFKEIFYSNEFNSSIYNQICLAQKFRGFFVANVWA